MGSKGAFVAEVKTAWLGQIFSLTITAESAIELERRCKNLKEIIDSTTRPDNFARDKGVR